MLALLNAHERDARICFYEENHRYTVDEKEGYTSATTFIKKFFEPFEADKILEKMRTSGSFEKKYSGLSNQQVKDKWECLRDSAAKKGTKLHKYIEDFYNCELKSVVPDDEIKTEVKMFSSFFRENNDLDAFRTEWFIFDETHKIAGSIDMVFSKEGKYYIYDWKCSKEIKRRGFSRAKAPISKLEDCNYIHYCLQLNLYKHILETFYGLKIAGMNLVVIHESNESPLIIPVGDYSSSIRDMLGTLEKKEPGCALPSDRKPVE